jgi:hypothetical protein
MTPPYSVHTASADTMHAKASAAKRLRSNALLVIDGPAPGFVAMGNPCNNTKVVQIFISLRSAQANKLRGLPASLWTSFRNTPLH